LTIAMMDVDDFKQVNDANGHAHGDAVLAKLASLTAYMRVGSLDRAFRVGGDEFALIMPETDTAEAHAVLERLRASIEASLAGITVSIGYSSAIGPTDPDLLRHHADMALYAAKRRGKNQVVAFYPAEGPSADVSTEQAEALRRALQTGNLSIWYQPIYEHRTGQLLAFEALLRLPSPPALLDSHEARRIASELGLTRDLDLLGIARALNAEGLPPDVKLFLSIDPATLMSPRFAVTELTELVSTSPFQPSQVVFQVAVDASVQAAALQRPLRAIQTAGFGLALTPAGTAQAGLEGLRAVHFDFVKVGRSILADAAAGDSEALL